MLSVHFARTYRHIGVHMNGNFIVRIVNVYYAIIACFVLWQGIIIPIQWFAFRPSGTELISVLWSALPSLLVVFVLVLTIRGLRRRSAWFYAISLFLQFGILLLSLVSSMVNLVFGVMSTAVAAYVILLLLHPSVERMTRFVTPQSNCTKPIIDRLLMVGIGMTVLLLLGWCSVSAYTAQTMSGYDAMKRLAGLSDVQATSPEIRSALLERTPVGTEKTTIVSFLEANGIARDRFAGGQFVRYQEGDTHILALFSTPPWVFTTFCSQYHAGVRYEFDENYKLEDIIIENYWYCL